MRKISEWRNSPAVKELPLSGPLKQGTRTGFMEGDWGIEHLQMLIEQAAKDPDVEWVGLINGDGVIIAHSEPAKIGLRLLMGEEMASSRPSYVPGSPLSRKRNLPERSDHSRNLETLYAISRPDNSS